MQVELNTQQVEKLVELVEEHVQTLTTQLNRNNSVEDNDEILDRIFDMKALAADLNEYTM